MTHVRSESDIPMEELIWATASAAIRGRCDSALKQDLGFIPKMTSSVFDPGPFDMLPHDTPVGKIFDDEPPPSIVIPREDAIRLLDQSADPDDINDAILFKKKKRGRSGNKAAASQLAYKAICAKDSDPEKSFQYISKAIELDPQGSRYYSQRGDLFRDKFKMYNEAIRDYTTAIKLGPGPSESPWLSRGHCFEKISEFSRALADYERACERGSAAGLACEDYRDLKHRMSRRR
jgi:tetratricopeptide (TPR) repeat protein